ncbi:hypothetical protein K4K60_010936 [Colletotrichum sp. SAR11_57]|nr:hypothetical protein K4K60_010936 [Colletotrichum sp. SAR11_57]
MSSQALRGAHRLTKTKHVFGHHTIPLECDVYSAEDYPATSPVFLYFHSGGLVTGSRSCVPPWLAQVCFRNKWPLNANFDVTTAPITEDDNTDEFPRGCLYDYYLYRNEFPGLVGDIDPGYEWAKAASAKDKVAAWPLTTIIQGNSNEDVDLAVSTHMVGCLGEDKAKLFLAEGQPHRYEATRFLEDDVDGMDAVRQAVSNLEADVARVA